MAKFTHQQKLENLRGEIKEQISFMVAYAGIECKHSMSKCLPIKDEDFMFNLEGGRYLIEVTETVLIDECGYSYDFNCLDIDEFFALADYIEKTYMRKAKANIKKLSK